MIDRRPGASPAGAVNNNPAAVWDLLPTFAEVGRIQGRLARTDGVSLIPVIRGKEGHSRRRLYWESHLGGFSQAVRIGPWKAIRPANRMQIEDIELYNLAEDCREERNVAKLHPDVVAEAIQQKAAKSP